MGYIERFSLKGKKCIVSGAAASGGIGIAIAEALAEAEGDIILCDVEEKNIKENTERIRSLGVQGYWHLCDITNKDSVGELKDFANKKFGHIDILVNNAGAFQDTAAEDMDIEEFKHILDVNLVGNFIMSQVFAREMIKRGQGGSIIFTSSKSGFTYDIPQKHLAYNTSKAGINMMAKGLAVEWARYGIRVNCIAPGNIATNENQKKIDENHPYIDEWLKLIPMKRIGSIEELGNLAIYLASDASSYVTGETILVDGGYCAI